jgi:nicotinate phosphoribosyltransferase
MPIINSLLDTDFYKFTMGQVVFLHYPGIKARFALKNRTKGVPLGRIIKEDDLRRELDYVQTLKFNRTEMRYLRGANMETAPMFRNEYLDFLENQLYLPPYRLEYRDDLILEFEGDWSRVIYWEIYALAIINELYYRAFVPESKLSADALRANGVMRLAEKARILKENPGIVFIDFGTRRRFSRDWQNYVVETLANEFSESQFRGTSNVWLAMKHGLLPMGTSAHEMFMVWAGARDTGDEAVRNSYQETLCRWYEQYGRQLSIALTDTFGSEYHFRTMTKWQAETWKGLRQDSGDPIAFGERAIRFYQSHGIDPREKLIIFSDGLEIDAIVKIHRHFQGRIKTSFGWGTNLTNDLGFKALSLVIKPVEANGRGLVKLSDNLAKAIGKPEDIERYKKIFDYQEGQHTECKY